MKKEILKSYGRSPGSRTDRKPDFQLKLLHLQVIVYSETFEQDGGGEVRHTGRRLRRRLAHPHRTEVTDQVSHQELPLEIGAMAERQTKEQLPHNKSLLGPITAGSPLEIGTMPEIWSGTNSSQCIDLPKDRLLK